MKDPNQPPHATKNRPDRDEPADIARGQAYVESIGLANAKDVVKMIRWNDRYGIKFMRLSSEMFPFASHEVYGYKLAPFASDVLAEAGKVAAELGHRLTTHPGQVSMLGTLVFSVADSCLVHAIRFPPEGSHQERFAGPRLPCRIAVAIEAATTAESGRGYDPSFGRCFRR